MTPEMFAILEFVRGLGHDAHHEPDNDHCNEQVKWVLNGSRMEIECGGPGCSGGAAAGWVVLMYQGGGDKFELADPLMFEKLAEHLRECYPAKRKPRKKRVSRVTPQNPFGFIGAATLLAEGD